MNRSHRLKRLSSKAFSSHTTFNRTPELMETIEVLWNLNGVTVWWPAEVIDVTPATHGKKNTTATIRYYKKRKYSAMDYEVSFRIPNGTVKKLQHTSPPTDSLTPWKFPDEVTGILCRQKKNSSEHQQQQANDIVASGEKIVLNINNNKPMTS